MTYDDGWAAMNLEMPPRVPREEFDAENHWPLVKAVTGIDLDVHSDEQTRQRARSAFIRAWNYDVCLSSLVGADFLAARRLAYPVVSASPNRLWNATGAFHERGMSAAARICL